MSAQSVRVGRRTIKVSNPDKALFPDDGVTKKQLVDYYRDVAPAMLRHLRGRPLALQRFPDGISGQSFFQKEVSDHFPDWIRRATMKRKEGGTVTQVVCDDAATLAYLADQACITPHAWLSQADRPDTPDRMIFDLDPTREDLDSLRLAATGLRDLLDDLGLVPFVMTTGSRGFHVTVPLRRGTDFDEVRRFAHELAQILANSNPDRFTVELPKERRGTRVFLDYLRNSYAQTSVVPYAVRARPEAPVATPLNWDELPRVRPDQFTVDDIADRLDRRGDPWSELPRRARSLDAARRRLQRRGRSRTAA